MDLDRLNLKDDGLKVIRALFNQSEISDIAALLLEKFDTNKTFAGLPDRDKKDKRMFNLPGIDYKFIEFIFNEKILDTMKNGLQDEHYRWIPDSYCNFILNSCSARSSGNFLDLHIDSNIPFVGEYPMGYVVIMAIEPTNKANGATCVVPNTHNSGTYTDRSLTDIPSVELFPGDVAVLDSRLWHGAGENKSGASRWTVNAHFTRWFVKQDVNIPLTLSQEIYEQCSVQDRILLGYCSMSTLDPDTRVNIKCGIDHLKTNVSEYL